MTNQLSIADLASLHSLIAAAAERGAYKAQELSHVGAVFDKLDAFLKQVTEQASKQQSEAQVPTDQNQGEANA
jgi:hypothetical protein